MGSHLGAAGRRSVRDPSMAATASIAGRPLVAIFLEVFIEVFIEVYVGAYTTYIHLWVIAAIVIH